MYHSFSVDVAKKHGVEAAILIQNFEFWIAKNKANGRHFHEGRYWTYNSARAFSELFPYWSKKQIERLITKLVDEGVLLTGNFNEDKFNRTCWYTLTKSGDIDIPKSGNGCPEIGISLDRTDVNTDTCASDESRVQDYLPKKSERERLTEELFAEFWGAYPRKRAKDEAMRAFSKRKPTKELLVTMLAALARQCESQDWKRDDGKFIPYPATWINGGRWLDDEQATAVDTRFFGAI